MDADQPMRLLPHQKAFVDSFVEKAVPRTLLVARAGEGKTLAAMVAMDRLIYSGAVIRVLIITSTQALAEEWERLVAKFGYEFRINSSDGGKSRVTITTITKADGIAEHLWANVPDIVRWLFVFDDVRWKSDDLEIFSARALARHPGSRCLFISNRPPPIHVDEQFEFTAQVFDSSELVKCETRNQIQLYAPSFGLIWRIQSGRDKLDDISWRDFEKLIADMLERDGYDVDLLQGTKDGGVDVVATKDLGPAGTFKSVWQAKKNRVDRKIGLSLVRELADTRLEHSASKAVIVTTSYLTAGALQRVERDKYLLGKVDRDDLQAWLDGDHARD